MREQDSPIGLAAAERRLRARYPGIRYVSLDPTHGVAGRNHRQGGADISGHRPR